MESFKDVYRKLFLRGHDPKNEEMFFATFGMVAVGVYNFVSRRPFYSSTDLLKIMFHFMRWNGF